MCMSLVAGMVRFMYAGTCRIKKGSIFVGPRNVIQVVRSMRSLERKFHKEDRSKKFGPLLNKIQSWIGWIEQSLRIQSLKVDNLESFRSEMMDRARRIRLHGNVKFQVVSWSVRFSKLTPKKCGGLRPSWISFLNANLLFTEGTLQCVRGHWQLACFHDTNLYFPRQMASSQKVVQDSIWFAG